MNLFMPNSTKSNICAMEHFHIIVASILTFGIGGNTSVVFKQFTSQPDYFQATCQEGDSVLSEKTRSKTECLALCAQNANCYTAFYNQPKCRGCSNFYASDDISSEGTTHYQWTSACGDGWQLWNKSCYRLSEPGTFHQGQAYCEEKEATAVAVETESENEFLKQMVRSLTEQHINTETGYTAFFLGITNNCNGNGEWRQTADGEVISFQDFSIGEPNNPTVECCIALFNLLDYKWVDISCSGQYSTICEKQLL